MSVCIDRKQDEDQINTTYNLPPQPVAKAFIAMKLHDLSCDKCSDVC